MENHEMEPQALNFPGCMGFLLTKIQVSHCQISRNMLAHPHGFPGAFPLEMGPWLKRYRRGGGSPCHTQKKSPGL